MINGTATQETKAWPRRGRRQKMALDQTATILVLQKLDQILERQRDNRDLLLRHSELLLQGLDSEVSSPPEEKESAWRLFRVKTWSPFWQSMAAGGLMWIFGLCTRAYLSRGGDPMVLFELVVKSVLSSL